MTMTSSVEFDIDPNSPPPQPGPPLPEGTQSQRWSRGKDRPVPPGGYVDTSRLQVEPVSFADAKRFVLEHHYAGTYPADVARYGMFQEGRDGKFRLAGVCVFSTHVNPASSARWVRASVDPLELMPPLPSLPPHDETNPEEVAKAEAAARAQHEQEIARLNQRREAAVERVIEQAIAAAPPEKRAEVMAHRAEIADGIAARQERIARIVSGPIKSLDLGRFVLLPELEGNAETFFLRRALWGLARDKPEYDLVISMSDPMSYRTREGKLISPGHYGGIYIGAGLRHVGRSRPEKRRLAQNGRIVNGRMLAKARKPTESGHDGAIETLIGLGAPPPKEGESSAAYVARALQSEAFYEVDHPGNLVYAAPVSQRYARLVNARLLPALPPPTSAARVPCPMFLDRSPRAPALPLTWALP